MGGIIHVLSFAFKDGLTSDTIEASLAQLRGLKDGCVSATTQKPYIKSFHGGVDVSPEGFQNGFTHMFVIEFESVEDRDYYLKGDPVHIALASTLGPLVSKLQVLDIAA